MTLETKRIVVFLLGLALCGALLLVVYFEGKKHFPDGTPQAMVPADSQMCVDCHSVTSGGIVHQWERSTHGQQGIGCMDCHRAEPGDPTGFRHEGVYVSSIVTPLDCRGCHLKETEEFFASHHNTAALFTGSLDNVLGEFVEGREAAVAGCDQCHGSRLSVTQEYPGGESLTLDMGEISRQASDEFQAEGRNPMYEKDAYTDRLQAIIAERMAPFADRRAESVTIDSDTWPNTGMGRINPDGSLGSCTACHSRHDFSRARARQPENCGKCHMGPDHPQIEIFEESKHGIAYRDREEEMNLDHPEWVVGRDYWAAPTCATCHMSAYRTAEGVQPATHDVGLRISWTLRPPVSPDPEVEGLDALVTTSRTVDEAGNVEPVELGFYERRERMQQVCAACHGPSHIEGFYDQYDGVVRLYNEKFGRPARRIYEYIQEQGYLRPAGVTVEVPFYTELDWVYFELWHHEGRRMRMGASMMGPDYTHWHGSYEVAKHFYIDFIPLVLEVAEEHEDEELRAMVEEVLSDDRFHAWRRGLSEEDRRRLQEADYYERYGERYGREGAEDDGDR